MRDVDARVTGFDYTTFHTYTTEVEVDGRTWTLGIRYNTFYQFYVRLLALEKYFTVNFPPKGGLFFSPSPEERQEQLDEFLLSTLAYFDMRGHPKRMASLLDELFQISEHLGIKNEEEEHTASEGSSEEHDDYLVSSHEDENHTSRAIVDHGHQVEAVEVDHQGLKSEVEDEVQAHDAVEHEAEQEAVDATFEAKQEHAKGKAQDGQQQLTGGAAANDYITKQRRKTLVNGAIQTAVVSTMKENVEKSKAEKTTEEQQPVKEDNVMEVEVEMQQKKVEVEEKPATLMVEKKTETHEELIQATPAQAVIETTAPLTEREEHVLEPAAPIEADQGTAIELDAVAKESISAPQFEEQPIKEHESSTQDGSEEPVLVLVPCKKELEPENPVVGWFRRMITLGSSSDETEEQEAVKLQEEVEEEEAAAQAETEATEAEACIKAEEAEEEAKAEAKLMLAEQERNLRLKRYRHPVFFRSFICDIDTSRYSCVVVV